MKLARNNAERVKRVLESTAKEVCMIESVKNSVIYYSNTSQEKKNLQVKIDGIAKLDHKSISNKSEKEDNDALDLCEYHDSDEIKWTGGHSPTNYNNKWEELYTETNLNAVTNKYGCRLQHSQRNVKHEVQNKDDCDLNGSMWDNNNLHQLQIKGNSNMIRELEPKRDVTKGKFISSSKLHNHKTENSVKTIHNTTKSQRKTLYFLPNVPDNSIKDQTIEQRESVLSQSVPISSSACIKNIITPHKLHINHNNVTSYKNMLVTTPNKQAYMLRNHVDISNNRIKNQNTEQQESILSHSLKISSSTCINNIITPHTLHEKEKINHKNVTSYENMLVTTPNKQAYMLRNHVDIFDNRIKNQTVEQQESILSQSFKISSSTCIKTISTPHKLHENEKINHNNVTSYENMLVTTPHKQTYLSRKNVDISDNNIKKQTIEQQESILSPRVHISSSTCIQNMITQHKVHEKETQLLPPSIRYSLRPSSTSPTKKQQQQRSRDTMVESFYSSTITYHFSHQNHNIKRSHNTLRNASTCSSTIKTQQNSSISSRGRSKFRSSPHHRNNLRHTNSISPTAYLTARKIL